MKNRTEIFIPTTFENAPSQRPSASNHTRDISLASNLPPTTNGSTSNLTSNPNSASSLLDIWSQACNNISPRTSPVTRPGSARSLLSFSPNLHLAPTPTPNLNLAPNLSLNLGGRSPSMKKKLDLDSDQDLVSTRLEALMNSLTLSDSSLDITIGNYESE
ncbi:uncharacterized protein LOC111708860 [Eurytemora carolleeae]|uniref:uncharacterized protein LOC111708860 n=1 Tax=Eurytemora carolleeae TaxID=1294199 RepID=UPI000C77FB59|nr:uncharacterized protein LOC111708860 [Eurytemora carolleeae]XP_023338132.1 uncharacterized protein LOC111708860 [Eurytemora carolleeae]|eukprot:XP_023338131.1 uncharacterized protein LOC111708860 [Eurytemora affinis]